MQMQKSPMNWNIRPKRISLKFIPKLVRIKTFLHTSDAILTIFPCQIGVISVNSLLDYEEIQLIVATVVARDAGSPPLTATALINVTLTDVNDNAPVFSQAAYRISVPEDQMPGRSLSQVRNSNILLCQATHSFL